MSQRRADSSPREFLRSSVLVGDISKLRERGGYNTVTCRTTTQRKEKSKSDKLKVKKKYHLHDKY